MLFGCYKKKSIHALLIICNESKCIARLHKNPFGCCISFLFGKNAVINVNGNS